MGDSGGRIPTLEHLPVVLPYQHAAGAPPVTQVRSTLVAASLQGMRRLGVEARYFERLPTALHDRLRTLVPGSWVEVELARAHYLACDALHLDAEQVQRVGETVSERTQGTYVDTVSRVAGGSAATPWDFLGTAHRIWGRMISGADLTVLRAGPQEAVIVVVRCSLLEIQYFREAMRAYFRALGTGMTRTFHATEMRRAEPDAMGLRLRWT